MEGAGLCDGGGWWFADGCAGRAPLENWVLLRPHCRRLRLAGVALGIWALRWDWVQATPGGGAGDDMTHPLRQRLLSMKAVSWDFDTAPTLVASTSPPLNSIRVGMPRML